MIKRKNQQSSSQTTNITDYSSKPSTQSQNHLIENKIEDIVLSLSNEYENKRARQVLEWEKIRLNSFKEFI